MKAIGLIGGMSWNSTLEYYRLINEITAEKLGDLHSAHILMDSLDFEEIARMQHEARWDEAAVVLVQAGSALRMAGADFLVLCTNTMHKLASSISDGTGLPLLHIGDVVGEAVKKAKLPTVGLLGTQFVMEESFYKDRLQENFGINVLVPSELQRKVINEIIYEELCKESIRDESLQKCLCIIDDLVSRGAEGIVLGCTELPLLIHPENVVIPLFDTTKLHAEAAVELALS